jgi:hypothetical protein
MPTGSVHALHLPIYLSSEFENKVFFSAQNVPK